MARQRKHAVVGAGKRVTNENVASLRSLRQKWQEEAWDYYHTVGELKAAARFVANSLAKIHLYVGVVVDPREAPVLWDPDDPELRRLVDPEIADLAVAELETLWSPFGGRPHIQSELSLNLEIAGEAYLVEEEEGFEVRSTSEVEVRGSREVIIRNRPGEQGARPINIDENYVARIWLRDPQWSDFPDSHFQGVLDDAEALLMLTRQIRSEAASRLNAGALLMPQSIKQQAGDPTVDQGEEDSDDPFVDALETALIEPIDMPGSARAAAPFVIWVPDQIFETAKPEHLDFARPSDSYLEARIEQRVERMGRSLDLPVEVVQGKRHSTFNNAAQIDRDIFDDHLEHRVISLSGAIDMAFVRERLMERFEIPIEAFRRLRVWGDPSPLLRNPAEKDDAKDAHKAMAISDAALRRRLEFSDEDAPDDAELARRTAQNRVVVPGELFPSVIEQDNGDRPAIAAAIPARSRPSMRTLSDRLAEIDRGLLDRTLSDADAAVRSVLRQVGSQLRRRLQSKPEQVLVAGLAPEQVAAKMGRALVAQVGDPATDEIAELLEREMGSRFVSRVERAQRESVRAATDAFDAELPPIVATDLDSAQEEDRNEAWLLLLAALGLVVSERLFRPTVEPPQVGEFDETRIVDAGAIRPALARAGGALATETGPGGAVLVEGGTRPAGQVATGERLRQVLGQAFVATVGGWRWVYGDPGSRTVPFEPHRRLGGVEFVTWDDDVLSNFGATWPPVSAFRPGDHRGCQCSFTPLIAEMGESES